MKLRRLTVLQLVISSSVYTLAHCTLNPAPPSVTICALKNGATVSSPVNVVAGTTDSQPVTLLHIYLDEAKVYQVAGAQMSTKVTTSAGTHRLTVQAKNSARVVQPNPGHSMHPGSGSATTAANWLAGVVQKIQNSSTWPSTAIVITWDESGGRWDHVSPPQVDPHGLGARVPLIVVSPYAKRGYISHVQTDYVSILRFTQWNFGLSSLNARNALSNNLLDLFELP